ncbi:3'-5' exonuclease [Acinetobacter radioresistens]|uniref:3'-5' exonuclease n=1 Tax=Acinetobacter radioresistens TaxID=40216 RepID=UPI00321368EC
MPESTELPLLPNKEEINKLPLFKNLDASHIYVLSSLKDCLPLQYELVTATVVGFDSESKPTFRRGEISTGPHLIQLATAEKVLLFQLNPDILNFLRPILANQKQVKVGFGLKNDVHLFRKKGIELQSTVELSKCFSAFGFKQPIGLKNAVALLFQQNFPKSKKISISDWSNMRLSSAQIGYAAADVYAALLVFQELRKRSLLPEHTLRLLEQVNCLDQ